MVTRREEQAGLISAGASQVLFSPFEIQIKTKAFSYISNEKSDIRVPYVLGNAVYIETNLSSDYSIYFAFRVLDEMGLERSDLSITLEEK